MFHTLTGVMTSAICETQVLLARFCAIIVLMWYNKTNKGENMKIKIGALCKNTLSPQLLCEIVSLYDKRDIDWECPQSVAIIPFVKAIWLSGRHQGQVFRQPRKNFRRSWTVISDTEHQTTLQTNQECIICQDTTQTTRERSEGRLSKD